MPKPSSPSVKVTYFPKQAVWDALRRLAAELPQSHPEVRRIIVFGSVASGRAVPGSDIDLILTLDSSTERFIDRIPTYTPFGLPAPVQVFPYTTEEIERMTAQGNQFIKRALADGIVLFDRDAA